jgi:hypothetical protein
MRLGRGLLLCVVAVMLASSAARAQQHDSAFLADYLGETRQKLLDSVSGLSEEQANFKPAPERWSISEVVEHLALTEEGLGQMVREAVASPAASADKLQAAKGGDDKVLAMIPDRSRKAQAPEQFRPTGKFGGFEGALKEFKAKRQANLEYAAANAAKLRQHTQASPFGTDLDAYQWLLFIGAHSKRHTAQIEEIKADAKFPKT